MKKSFVLLSILFFAKIIMAQTLVASYPFIGNANDVSGNANNGTVTGAVLATDRFGNANRAYSFSGGSDKISASDQTWLNLTNTFTIAGWIYPTATPSAISSGTCFTIASKDISPGNNQPKWIFGLQNGALAFHINSPGLGSGEWTVSNTFTLLLNKWYYCVLTKNGNTVNYYLNGVNIGTATYVGALIDPAGAPLTIGYSEPGLTTSGKLDEIEIYNSILSAQQIASNYNSQSLVASYPFNNNANDISSNGNNGTVNGASLTSDRFGNVNSAYNFNGTSNYIDVPNSVSLQLSNSYTLSAWVKTNAFYSGSCQANFILAKGDQFSEGHYNLQYGDFLDFSCGVFTPTNENFASTIKKGGADQSVYENPSTQPVALNNWYYVVCTYDGTTQKLFVNGKLRASNTTSGSFGTLNTGNLFIGKSNDGSGYFVNGTIDDVKIYNTPLSEQIIFDTYINDVKKPGSGNSLSFDGSSQYVECVANASTNIIGAFCIESWINPSSYALVNEIIHNGRFTSAGDPQTDFAGYQLRLDNGSLNLIFSNASSVDYLQFNLGATYLNKWTHVAGVYDGSNAYLYVNGMLVASKATSQTLSYYSNTNLRIGKRNDGQHVFNGSFDELRIWNVALTQTQIRDWMCKKITSTHPAFANLVSYFRFDEGSNTTIGGFAGNFGTLINTPTWQTSGASLGDASAHDYVNATKTANISHASGENFSVTSTSGSPAGIQVYRVDEQPNTLTGASGVGVNNKYFGVFQVGGTSPQYTAVYNYNGNPSVVPAIENQLRLNKRNDNATGSWTLLPDVANEPANTITVIGQSTEYILGRIGGVLPITSFAFNAVKKDKTVLLSWNYLNNDNVVNYEVERSVENTSFIKMANITAKENNIAYQHTDNNPAIGINYYRIKTITKTGSIVYSQIIKIDFGKQNPITISPNPASSFIAINTQNNFNQIDIVDINGRVVKRFNRVFDNKYNVAELARGVYLIRLRNAMETFVSKIVIE